MNTQIVTVRPTGPDDVEALDQIKERRLGGERWPFLYPDGGLNKFGTIAFHDGRPIAYGVSRMTAEVMLAGDVEAPAAIRMEAYRALSFTAAEMLRAFGLGEIHAIVPPFIPRWPERLVEMGWEKQEGVPMLYRFGVGKPGTGGKTV